MKQITIITMMFYIFVVISCVLALLYIREKNLYDNAVNTLQQGCPCRGVVMRMTGDHISDCINLLGGEHEYYTTGSNYCHRYDPTERQVMELQAFCDKINGEFDGIKRNDKFSIASCKWKTSSVKVN